MYTFILDNGSGLERLPCRTLSEAIEYLGVDETDVLYGLKQDFRGFNELHPPRAYLFWYCGQQVVAYTSAVILDGDNTN